jgi:hypothetical protein
MSAGFLVTDDGRIVRAHGLVPRWSSRLTPVLTQGPLRLRVLLRSLSCHSGIISRFYCPDNAMANLLGTCAIGAGTLIALYLAWG